MTRQIDPPGPAQVLALAMVAPVAGAALWAGNAPLVPAAVAAGCAAVAGLALLAGRRWGAHLLALALVGQAAAMTGAFAGHPWQSDSHLMFAVVPAAVATTRRPGAVATAVVATALHHLACALWWPGLIYPTATIIANLSRTVFNGAMVTAGAAMICWAILPRTPRPAPPARGRRSDRAVGPDADPARPGRAA